MLDAGFARVDLFQGQAHAEFPARRPAWGNVVARLTLGLPVPASHLRPVLRRLRWLT
jgi:hypothetical protein